ncbi:MAG TPA: MFS transporter, partial [Bacteroidales bacterium]|nr:MFS transporter [Bacteroidales bacterium]
MNSDRIRQLLTVTAIAIAMFMTNLDTSIVNIAMPTLARYFQADTDGVSRVVLSYLLAMVSFLLIFGQISDRRGHERIFLLGYAVFTLASALCGFAPTLLLLNLFRFLQGIGSAMLLASWGAIAVKYIPAEIRGRVFGIITVFGGVGMALGAPVGGFLLTWLSWRWIFLINLPFGFLAIVLIRMVLDLKHTPASSGVKFDYLGSGLSLVGLFCLFLLLNTGKDAGWLCTKSIILGSVAILGLTGFYFRERNIPSPLLNIRHLSQRNLL